LAKRKGRQREGDPVPSRFDLLDRLTDRQREALERAYREGYFEIPKGTTGESLATSMDISTSAFHNHLRSAEAELFAWLLDDESDR
jgi:predicted DNA binding protein